MKTKDELPDLGNTIRVTMAMLHPEDYKAISHRDYARLGKIIQNMQAAHVFINTVDRHRERLEKGEVQFAAVGLDHIVYPMYRHFQKQDRFEVMDLVAVRGKRATLVNYHYKAIKCRELARSPGRKAHFKIIENNPNGVVFLIGEV